MKVFPQQRRFHMDESACRGGGIGWQRQRSPEPGATGHQHSPRGAPFDSGCGRGRRPGGSAHQFARGEAENAPPGWIPLGPNRRHLHCL